MFRAFLRKKSKGLYITISNSIITISNSIITISNSIITISNNNEQRYRDIEAPAG